MINTGKQLAAAAKIVAQDYKTIYALGTFGWTMTAGNKARAIKVSGNGKRADKINAATADIFAFDCVGLVKGLLWGWNGSKAKSYGGATYQSNNVPDWSANAMIKVCKDVSTNFQALCVGEYLWMDGHCGIYIGGGLAVECTPAWNNCVQITAVGNIAEKSGYPTRTWEKHGKLPYVKYEAQEAATAQETTEEETVMVNAKKLKKGCKGAAVKALQALLICYGYSCGKYGVDGDFGSGTLAAVRSYQADKGLTVDGIVGKATWGKLLGV